MSPADYLKAQGCCERLNLQGIKLIKVVLPVWCSPMRRFYCRSRDHSCCLNNTLEMLLYLEVILLYISLFPKNSAGSSPCRTSFSDKDHVLTGHVMRTLNHKTFESCTFSCELEPQCFSVNYISLHKTCQLNNATKEYFPGDLVQRKGAFYMGMVVRSYNPCESMRCENGGTCVSSPSLKCECPKGFSGLHCDRSNRSKDIFILLCLL